MKKQTFISCVEDGHGRTVDFERWTYAKPATVVDACQKLYNSTWGGVYKRDFIAKQATTFSVYATPDGYHETKCVYRVAISSIVGGLK